MAKKKIGKHLQFYIDCMNNDCVMPVDGISIINGGLCRAANVGHISEDLLRLFSQGMNTFQYWANIEEDDDFQCRHKFNPLRQTIVLFMAAINNEL